MKPAGPGAFPDPFFVVTSTGFRCPWARRCVESVLAQTYRNFAHVYIAADDFTARVARDARIMGKGTSTVAVNPLVRVVESPHTVVENVYSFWRTVPDDQVIVWLDGDDWLESERSLEILADVYRHRDPWLTYGSFRFSSNPGVDTPLLGTRYATPHPRREPWRASHLKSFRAGLVKRVREEDLRRPDGSWTEYCTDRVFMLPMLEMAGPNYEVVSDVLSVYNWEASFSFRNQGNNEANAREEAERARIHAMPEYARLEERPW
jgi:hypothetical protein